jgi:hypothetical protein
MNGTINLDYLPGNGVFSVTNGGGKGTQKFLEVHGKYFGTMPSNTKWGVLLYWLETKRLGKFRMYAESKGFTVVVK